MLDTYRNGVVGRLQKNALSLKKELFLGRGAQKLELVESVICPDELKVPPGNRLEALSGDRKGQYSIRVNEKYRICFKWTGAGPDELELTDCH